jgi:hypothetical protein
LELDVWLRDYDVQHRGDPLVIVLEQVLQRGTIVHVPFPVREPGQGNISALKYGPLSSGFPVKTILLDSELIVGVNGVILIIP